jgi:hypothetical protein
MKYLLNINITCCAVLYKYLKISCHIERSRNVFNQSSITLPKTDSISCHLDDRRDLFVRRDFSSRTRRNDSTDAAFYNLHIEPNKIGWALRIAFINLLNQMAPLVKFINLN